MVLGLIVIFHLLVAVPANVPAHDHVIESCEKLFGPQILPPELFEVSKFYVLHIDRDATGHVAAAAIEPKYYYRDTHPDWKESEDFQFLSVDQFTDLVARLETLRPKGAFIRRNDSTVVTNTTCWRKAEHENAVMEWGELCDARRGGSGPKLIRWIKVSYSTPHEGK